MDDPTDLPPAPENYRTAGLLMMIAGGANILLGLVWARGLAGSLYGLACCWAPLLAVGVGIAEIVVGAGVRAGLEGGASALLRGKDVKPWLDAALERERRLMGG